MSDCIAILGREGIGDSTISLSASSIGATLLDLATASNAVKNITIATNATPIVITSTAHGFTNGDFVCIQGVVGNLSANGRFKIANVALNNTFELTDPVLGTNIQGSGAYTSGGVCVNVGPSTSGDNWDDYSASAVGSSVTLTSQSIAQGTFSAANPTFASVSGSNPIKAIILRKVTGTPSTERVIAYIDGKQSVVIAANAAGTSTSVAVERLRGGIPNGTVIGLSNGVLMTLSALANAGDRTLTVISLPNPIVAGNRGEAPITGSGLPITPNGGNITIAFDTGANKIFTL